MPGIADLFSAQAPASQPVINAPQQLQNYDAQQTQNQQRMAETAGATQGIQDKSRAMQFNMLSGILNEPDPEKQTALAQKIIPIANKLNPSYQINPAADIGTIRALVQSQVSPTDQATLANNLQRFQMANAVKQEQLGKDATGNNILINKLTGEIRYPSQQEEMQAEANGGILPSAQAASGQQPAPNTTGIFPNMSPHSPQAAFQNFKGQAAAGAAPPQTDFGFDMQPVNPKEYTANIATTKAWKDADQANRPLFQNMQDKINAMRPNIKTLGDNNTGLAGFGGAGSGLGDLEIGTKKLLTTGPTTNAAEELTSQANDLATMATQLQGAKTGNRGSVLQLKTALASKPNTSNTPQVNNDLLDEMEAKVARADADSALYEAYINANGNTQHTLDNRAYQLADALDKKFPILDKNGKLNPDNLDQWKAAIPDALANPKQFLNAKNDVQGRLQQAAQPSKAPAQADAKLQGGEQPQGTPIIKTQADFDKLPSGTLYVETDGKKYRKP